MIGHLLGLAVRIANIPVKVVETVVAVEPDISDAVDDVAESLEEMDL